MNLFYIYRRLLCFFGLHTYLPTYKIRSFNSYSKKKNKLRYRNQFQFTCVCCKRNTKWLPFSKLETFMTKKHISWKNYDFED